MTTQLSLYNGALLHLGERALSSLTEARESRRLLDTVWARPAIRDCLEQGQWKFALRTRQVEADSDVDTEFGHPYAFSKPSDFVRTVMLCSDEFFQNPLLNYDVDAAYWYASVTPLYIKYVSDDENYGNNFAAWPGNFTRYVEAYLAEAIVTRITQDQAEWQRIRALMAKYKSEAMNTDAMEQPTRMPPTGSWVRSRSERGSGDRGNKHRLIG